MATDGSLDIPALARLKDGLTGMPVPAYGDLPDAARELIYLAVSTAQTRTERLPRIMHNRFFPLFPDLDAVSESDLPRIEAILTPLGGQRKTAGRIVGVVRAFRDQNMRYTDAEMRRLEAEDRLWGFLEGLRGVGPKTVECLRVFSFDLPGLPLDTHNARVLFRFGALRPEVVGADGKVKRDSIPRLHHELRDAVSNGEGRALHNRLMGLGMKICTSRKPRCESCPLAAQCLRQGVAPASVPGEFRS